MPLEAVRFDLRLNALAIVPVIGPPDIGRQREPHGCDRFSNRVSGDPAAPIRVAISNSRGASSQVVRVAARTTAQELFTNKQTARLSYLRPVGRTLHVQFRGMSSRRDANPRGRLLRSHTAMAYGRPMPTPQEEAERAKAEDRTRRLIRAAAAAFQDPGKAQFWLLNPHLALRDMPPATAAWCDDLLAQFATHLLAFDAALYRRMVEAREREDGAPTQLEHTE